MDDLLVKKVISNRAAEGPMNTGQGGVETDACIGLFKDAAMIHGVFD